MFGVDGYTSEQLAKSNLKDAESLMRQGAVDEAQVKATMAQAYAQLDANERTSALIDAVDDLARIVRVTQ